MNYEAILAILISLGLSAFFSGTEIAFVSANRLHIELKKSRGTFSARILSIFVKNSSHFIATMLVGNTITLVLYGIYMASILDPIILETFAMLPFEFSSDVTLLIIQTFLSTLLVLIVAEFMPKSLFLINPNFILTYLSIPIVLFYYLLYPFVFVIVGFSHFVFKNILRIDYSEDQPVFGLIDLNNYLSNTTITQQEEESQPEVDTREIINNALVLKDLKVRDCMIPRTEIKAIDIEETIEKLRQGFVESGYSKILIYRETIDDIIGYCHSSAMFKKPEKIEEVLSELVIVPETLPAQNLLVKLTTERRSLALVVDEFGGTAGIVTLEDIVEEIFGEIHDEYDKEYFFEKRIDDSTFILSGRHEIDYLNEKYDWDLPKDEFETLGGFIIHLYEDLPPTNKVIFHEDFTFTVLSIEQARIDTIKVYIRPQIQKV